MTRKVRLISLALAAVLVGTVCASEMTTEEGECWTEIPRKLIKLDVVQASTAKSFKLMCGSKPLAEVHTRRGDQIALRNKLIDGKPIYINFDNSDNPTHPPFSTSGGIKLPADQWQVFEVQMTADSGVHHLGVVGYTGGVSDPKIVVEDP